MSTAIIDNYIDRIYNEKLSLLEAENERYERVYFSNNFFRIFNGELLQDSSYNRNIRRYKSYVVNLDEEGLDFIFKTLKDFYFFSGGNDMVFRKKIEADCYHATPIKKIIYPRIERTIHNRFFESDCFFHSNNAAHINAIEKTIDDYFNVSAFLHYLYCNDFNPGKDIRRHFSNTYDKCYEKLMNSDLTIGEYLRAFINYKCDLMIEVFNCIDNNELRSVMIGKVNNFRFDKLGEIDNSFYHNLHVCYFFNHTIYDFIDAEEKSKQYRKAKEKLGN